MLRESKKYKERENEGFYNGFLGSEYKEGQKSPIIFKKFKFDCLIQGYGWIDD